MKKNLIFAILSLACAAVPVSAAEQPDAGFGPAAVGGFSDPALQDFMETSGGYLNSKNTMNVRSDFRDFRDSVVSTPAPTLKNPVPAARALPEDRAGLPALPAAHYKVTFAGDSGPVGSFVWPLDSGDKKYAREYVLLGVAVGEGSYDQLLLKLEAAGLRFAGEKISYAEKTRKTAILGWAPYENVTKITKISGVAGVTIEKKSKGAPFKARIRFTLKVPYQNKPNVFVPEFIKRLADDGGFDSEAWVRQPQKNGDSRFSVFEVTGTLPVGMIGELSRSPFVASVEFSDPSL